MTKTVNVATSPAPLAELVSLALAGTEVVLTDGETPLVRLVPIAPVKKPRIAGLNAGAILTSEDFDAPLPDEFWAG
jgi:antitoxin (DNA-binding transcriptional repressor) of toxin-antitoxin stability system